MLPTVKIVTLPAKGVSELLLILELEPRSLTEYEPLEGLETPTKPIMLAELTLVAATDWRFRVAKFLFVAD
jgi:hypothetical protein